MDELEKLLDLQIYFPMGVYWAICWAAKAAERTPSGQVCWILRDWLGKNYPEWRRDASAELARVAEIEASRES